MRDPARVAATPAESGEPYAVFTDNNLGSNRACLRSLCAALRPLEKIWSAAVTLDVTDDPGLVREMALAGCTGVFVGFESLCDENLDEQRKKTPRTADYARRVKLFHDNGIQVNGSFVLGFDHDGPDVFARTADANRFWHALIKRDLVHTVWSPLVEWTRRRHLVFRRRLGRLPARSPSGVPGAVVSAGL